MSLKQHAERELKLLIGDEPDESLIAEFVPELLTLIEKFGNSGQSGGSAPYVSLLITGTLRKLLSYETLTPLTGEDSEWDDVSNYTGSTMYQNNRDSRVFKYVSEDGVVTYEQIDGIIWSNDDFSFTGSVGIQPHEKELISSSQPIGKFPFTPNSFVIDVYELNGDSYVDETFENICKLGEAQRYFAGDLNVDDLRAIDEL